MQSSSVITRYLIAVIGFAACSWVSAFAQQPAVSFDDNMMPDAFTQILKDEWLFLKNETDVFLKQTATRGEFETSPEFEMRIAKEKAAYVNKVNAHSKEKKFDKREFGVLLKANLKSYDANSQTYLVSCPTTIEAPYDIPTLISQVPFNPYVGITDTVRRAYRTSKVYLKFAPDFKWKVGREVARAAKVMESDAYFKVKLMVDLSQEDIKKQARLKIVPKEITLFDLRQKTNYWREEIK